MNSENIESSVEILISIYDTDLNQINEYKSCKYLKVVKNSLLSDKKPFYNQYQIMLEVPVYKIFEISPIYIYQIQVIQKGELIFNTFIYPKEINIVKSNAFSVLYNILGVSYNIYRFLNEETVCRITDYDKFFQVSKVDTKPFSTSVFGFFTERMLKVIDLFYGPYKFDTDIDNIYQNHSTITQFNLPITKNHRAIDYFFKNFYPVTDFMFFCIDDFSLINKTDQIDNFIGKIILNTYQNIQKYKKPIPQQANLLYNIVSVAEQLDIDKNFIYKFAYGDYIIHNVDQTSVNSGDEFTLPRVFGKKLKFDTLKSIHTVYFNYPVTKLTLNNFRLNFKTLVKKEFLSFIVVISNAPKEFFDINQILTLNGIKYYVYGGEYEFLPINEKNKDKTHFKLNCSIRALKID